MGGEGKDGIIFFCVKNSGGGGGGGGTKYSGVRILPPRSDLFPDLSLSRPHPPSLQPRGQPSDASLLFYCAALRNT